MKKTTIYLFLTVLIVLSMISMEPPQWNRHYGTYMGDDNATHFDEVMAYMTDLPNDNGHYIAPPTSGHTIIHANNLMPMFVLCMSFFTLFVVELDLLEPITLPEHRTKEFVVTPWQPLRRNQKYGIVLLALIFTAVFIIFNLTGAEIANEYHVAETIYLYISSLTVWVVLLIFMFKAANT